MKYSNYKILVVDDKVESLQTIVHFLKQSYQNCTIYQTNISSKALTIAIKELPDLIVTDWDMPDMNGIELMKALKSDTITRDIPVIIATGVMLTSDNLKLALDAGAMDYVRKPIDPVELKARVHSALVLTQYHRQMIDLKNKKLADNAVNLIKANEFNVEIKNKISHLANHLELHNVDSHILCEIQSEIDFKIKSNGWDQFESAFEAVHPNFKKTLLDAYPGLTPTELKYCAFIRMGMSSKDIASVLYLNPASVKVTRSRLRKKLALETAQNLEIFLSNF
ncbi:response regulator [Carboxylicivirga sp. N1Y90]|uniref:response regulator n=1 Tax=Carboxylicivirga fragile TaxID=3417571 RepID=UPI003D33A96A|nr:response regulator [Marinilabiliaceae bacterium N1Y90]